MAQLRQRLTQLIDVLQYKPAGAWNEEQFVITMVPRSREWFAEYFPVMRAFYDNWMTLKAAGVEHQPRTRPRKELDLCALPRGPYPFVPSHAALNLILVATGGEDDFLQGCALDAVLEEIASPPRDAPSPVAVHQTEALEVGEGHLL